MYQHLEQKDSTHKNFIVLGPWNHGGWADKNGNNLDRIAFKRNTAQDFQILQKQWFDYWLKGIGDGKFAEATSFQTGTNTWKTYASWPPKEATKKQLYTHADGTCSFTRPADNNGSVSYESDPENPCTIYEMTYLRTEQVIEIGSTKKLKVQNGKTKSQKLRFVIRDLAMTMGEDEDKFYDQQMDKVIKHYQEKIK